MSMKPSIGNKKYRITYKNTLEETVSVTLEAVNKPHLATMIMRNITDMLHNDADNIIRAEELCV